MTTTLHFSLGNVENGSMCGMRKVYLNGKEFGMCWRVTDKEFLGKNDQNKLNWWCFNRFGLALNMKLPVVEYTPTLGKLLNQLET